MLTPPPQPRDDGGRYGHRTAADRRSRRITMRLREDERTLIVAGAQRRRVTMTQYIIDSCRAATEAEDSGSRPRKRRRNGQP